MVLDSTPVGEHGRTWRAELGKNKLDFDITTMASASPIACTGAKVTI